MKESKIDDKGVDTQSSERGKLVQPFGRNIFHIKDDVAKSVADGDAEKTETLEPLS